MSSGLKAVKYRCPECGATHVRPRRFEGEPESTHENTCIAPHPARDAGFEGCGEVVELEAVAVRADSNDEWVPVNKRGERA